MYFQLISKQLILEGMLFKINSQIINFVGMWCAINAHMSLYFEGFDFGLIPNKIWCEGFVFCSILNYFSS